MPHVKPLNDALSLETYAQQKRTRFRLEGAGDSTENDPGVVEIPVQIVYRIHHLLKAYDGQAVASLEPCGMYRIEFIQLQRLVSELELVRRAISDPVTVHYLGPLLRLIKRSSGYPKSVLTVVSQSTS